MRPPTKRPGTWRTSRKQGRTRYGRNLRAISEFRVARLRRAPSLGRSARAGLANIARRAGLSGVIALAS